MQVASRYLLVWGIAYRFPHTTRNSPTYSAMLLAWSVTELIRYSYYVWALGGGVPRFWTWLRYASWFFAYPAELRMTRMHESNVLTGMQI